jgi:hypothetical protein
VRNESMKSYSNCTPCDEEDRVDRLETGENVFEK